MAKASTTPTPVAAAPSRPSDTAAGVSVLLAALANGFALWALWVIISTHERYRGRTDMDMPDWFDINMNLNYQVWALGAAGVLCLLVSGDRFLQRAGHAGWTMRIGFVLQWLVSATVVGFVVWSRLAKP